MVEGTLIKLQNMELTLPPLNFKALRKQDGLKKMKLVMNAFKNFDAETLEISDEVFEATVDLVWMAAIRNHPDVTKEEIEEGLDFGIMKDVLPILMVQNPVDHLPKNG